MTEFTREKPFVFGGIPITTWTTESGVERVTVESGRTVYPMNLATALAIHAFVEASRDSWHYTNADHTEARKGRWTVRDRGREGYISWALGHDDFPFSEWDIEASGSGRRNAVTAREVLRDFLAWHAAQNQPSEPTGLGAVVEVNGLRYTRVPWHDGDNKPWMQEGDCWNWSQFTSRGPVTVLSPGVES